MPEATFGQRARHEAARYGGGPWVFVRELLQNARDARARRVRFSTRRTADELLVSCRDDGDGMTFEHARRYLFRLYASSKDGRHGQAGRFGVGFWSVLAFEPTRIVVRSWPRYGAPWEVELDGALESLARRRPPPEGHGTEVRLHRSPAPPDGALQLQAAVAAFGRFLTRLDAPRRPLDVRVDGRAVAQPFDLPAPRLRFAARGLRGVVALAALPRVELLVRGLPVREAACLQDLLAPDERRAARAARPELSGGLAPAALLDSAAVEVLLSRDDVRAGRALAGLAERAERELDRLIERQLECLRPRSWSERWRDVARSPIASAALAGLLAVAAAGAFAALGGRRHLAPPARVFEGAARPADLAPYRDLGPTYDGAWSDEDRALPQAVALRYAPAQRQPRLAALVVPDPAHAIPAAVVIGSYGGARCRDDCLTIEAVVAVPDGAGPTRLPVPTGEVVDPVSLAVNGAPGRLEASVLGEPLVTLAAGRHAVRYRTGPGAWRGPELAAPGWSGAAADEAARLGRLPRRERVAAALAFVRARVRYSSEASIGRAHRQRALLPFEQRVLAVGAGDCDVQNGLLAGLLRGAGVPARLVVGYLGAAGRALPLLHAWVEHQAEDGSAAVADASTLDATTLDATQAIPRGPGLAPAPVAPAPAAQPDAREVAPGPGPTPAARGEGWGVAPLAGAGLVALVGLGGLAWRRRLHRRDVALDQRASLAELLRGVLENPRSFDHLPALLRRELLPAVGRRRLALGPAWRAAQRSRLFVSRTRPALARRAARAGLMVLDGVRDESRLVAEALGAIDLDEWQARLTAGRPGPLELLNRHLREKRERWRVLLLDGLGAPRLLVLPGVDVLPGERAERLLLVDSSDPCLARLETVAPVRPAQALLEALARLAPLAGLPAEEQLALLASPAAAALAEAAP